jgi:hypothetical protein
MSLGLLLFGFAGSTYASSTVDWGFIQLISHPFFYLSPIKIMCLSKRGVLEENSLEKLLSRYLGT